jgi:RNA-directed DNA polymerase
MFAERREEQDLNRDDCTHQDRSIPYHETRELALNSFARIRLHANRGGRDTTFCNLFTHINVVNLREAFRALDGSKAKGMDGISKSDYESAIDSNLKELVNRLHKGTYRPQTKKEVLIPKANGKMRPIAISAFEDKLVEWTLGKVLESVYEPIFIRNSFGFRPGKSAHDALQASYMSLKDNKRPFVVEIDLQSFFNTVSHRKLLNILKLKIKDPRLLSLVARFLKAEIHHQETGTTLAQSEGTPQGSIMSPILANIYLHYVLDQWFLNNYGSKDAVIVRYADDAIFMFKHELKAHSFLTELRVRLEKFELKLNEDKTAIIDLTSGRNGIFHFLGLSFYWAKRYRSSKQTLSVKTESERLKKKMQEFDGWIKKARNIRQGVDLLKTAKAKLQGHYNYFGYFCNRKALWRYYHAATWSLFRWLNRRSQKKSFDWERFKTIIAAAGIPRPPTMEKLRTIGWNPYEVSR